MIIDLIVKAVLGLLGALVDAMPKFEFDVDGIAFGSPYVGDIFDAEYLVSLISIIVTFEVGFLTYKVVKMIVNLIRGSGS